MCRRGRSAPKSRELCVINAWRDPFEERPEIKSRQKAPFALEHFHRQFVLPG